MSKTKTKAGKKLSTKEAIEAKIVTPKTDTLIVSDSDKIQHAFFMRERDNNPTVIRGFVPKLASKDAESMFTIACAVIHAKLEQGITPLFITGAELANIVQGITGINPLSYKKQETPFKQGIHRISKLRTNEIKQSRSDPNLWVDTFAFGHLSDGKSPLVKGNSPKGEGKRDIPNMSEKRYYVVTKLLGEYLKPSHETLTQACYWVSVLGHEKTAE
jgi:hypothetical protein